MSRSVRGGHILETVMGDYSYTERYADIAYSFLGKFVNIAAFTRINPSEHPFSAPRSITSCIAPATIGRASRTSRRF